MEKLCVLVTGAGGCLGQAAVNALEKAGFCVYAADIGNIAPRQDVIPVMMDVTSGKSVAEAAEFVRASAGKLFAIVHLAGVYTMDSFVEIEEAELTMMLRVNLLGAYRVNKAFLPLLAADGKKPPRILIVTSELAVLDPLPFNGIYSVTKTALDSYAHALAMELNLKGIRVVTLRPGAFGDGMPKASIRAMERMQKTSKLYPDVASKFKSIMLGEIGTSKDPAVFGEWLSKILQKRLPKFGYQIHNSLKLKLFSALPPCLQAWLLKKLLG